jgi:Zn-dependent protease/predicted transcriptional regulator
MTNGIPIGRFFGFPVRMHWSVLVMIWLFAWSLASYTLPAAAPGHSLAVYWLAGVCGAVLLMVSVLAHEIMHAVVARLHGLGVKDLTLWMFGGMATFTDEPKTPGADFRIAGAGPATSLALAGVFAGATAAGAAVGLDPLTVRVGWWLAGVNLLLGLFNLLPGAPLDGGRIFRAILWYRSKDRQRAAIGAARAGLVLGGVLIGLGLLEFLSGRFMGGIWTVFIGWFLLSAARTEQQQATVVRLLDGIRVRDVMTSDPVTAPGWFTVEALISRYVMVRPHSAFPVTDFDGSVRGLITLNQLRSVPPEVRSTTRVADVAIPLERVPKADPSELLVEVFARLTQDAGGRVLVFEDGRLVGIVTRADLSRILEVRSVAVPPGDGR